MLFGCRTGLVGACAGLTGQRRRCEGDAAKEQSAQRFHFDIEPLRPERQRNPGGVPETGLLHHIGIIRRANESMNHHAFRHVGNVPAEHLADRQIAEKDRRADRDRTDPLRLQQECAPRNIGLDKRRVLLSLECGLFLAPARRRQNADIRTRQKSVEAGDVAGEETRLDDPEYRSFGEQRRRLRVCRDGDEDVRIISRQPQALDRPKLDILELERRLAGLQTLGAVERDFDGRPFFRYCVPHQPSGDRDRQQWNQPDRREPARSTRDRLRRSRRCIGNVHDAPLWSDPLGSALAGNLFSTLSIPSHSRDHLNGSLPCIRRDNAPSCPFQIIQVQHSGLYSRDRMSTMSRI